MAEDQPALIEKIAEMIYDDNVSEWRINEDAHDKIKKVIVTPIHGDNVLYKGMLSKLDI